MRTDMESTIRKRPPSFSIASIIAVVAGFLSFATGAILGLIFAAIAILAGLFGIIVALSPSKRGGIVSVLAVVAGLVGVVAAVVKAIMWIF